MDEGVFRQMACDLRASGIERKCAAEAHYMPRGDGLLVNAAGLQAWPWSPRACDRRHAEAPRRGRHQFRSRPCELFRWRHPDHYCRIRYEDLVRDPRAAMPARISWVFE